MFLKRETKMQNLGKNIFNLIVDTFLPSCSQPEKEWKELKLN